MGKPSRDKGKRGERDARAFICGIVEVELERTQRGARQPDGDLSGLDDHHIEVKRVERLDLPAALRQAVEDSSASGRRPLVMHRRSKEVWKVTLLAEDYWRDQAELRVLRERLDDIYEAERDL